MCMCVIFHFVLLSQNYIILHTALQVQGNQNQVIYILQLASSNAFFQWKLLYFAQFLSKLFPNWQLLSFDSVKGLEYQNRHPAISWTNHDPIHWCIPSFINSCRILSIRVLCCIYCSVSFWIVIPITHPSSYWRKIDHILQPHLKSLTYLVPNNRYTSFMTNSMSKMTYRSVA